jgi:hypothetical protein
MANDDLLSCTAAGMFNVPGENVVLLYRLSNYLISDVCVSEKYFVRLPDPNGTALYSATAVLSVGRREGLIIAIDLIQ